MITGRERVLVVVPARNEEESICGVLQELRGELPTADVLVVDDGSTDHTVARARGAGARVAVARLPYHLGVGGAMRLGFRYARDRGYDVAVQVDADGQHDPRYATKLVDGLGDADVVVGARFAGVGDYRMRGPRRWAIWFLSLVLSLLAGTRLTDVTSGFRAANRRAIELFAAWYPVDYLGDTVETLIYAARRGFVVRQVPVAMRHRLGGSPSHSPVRALVYFGRAIITLLLALIRR